MKYASMKRIRLGSIWVVLGVALGLVACGGKEEAKAPPTSTPASTPAATASAPAPVVDAGGEATLVQPTLVDTLTVEELLVQADAAMKERRLFVPAGESAYDMYLRVIEQEPEQVRARNALVDLYPYAVMYVEQRTAASDLAESERVLAMIERADQRAPALPRLHRGVTALRDRIVAAEAQRQAAEAQRATAAAAPAAAPAPLPVEPPRPARVTPAAPAPVQAPPVAPAPAPVAAAPAPVAEPVSTPPQEPAPAPVAATPPPRPAPAAATPAPAPAPAVSAAPVMPTVISAVQPRYPPVALRRRVEGSVEVGFTIMPDGSVANVRVLSSRPGNTFDREAINAMERWRFTPPGRQVESRRVFDFKLNG